jgi:uncharacterized membrane protein YdjX (TVP38/TMEM64 family)
MDQLKSRYFLFKLVFLGLFFALIIFISIKVAPTLFAIASNPDKLKQWLALYGHLSMLIYIIILTLSMVMSPIPSEALLFTGGYLYGTFSGAACSVMVIFLGTVIAFWLTQSFGLPLVKLLVPAKHLEKSTHILQSPLWDRISFILFLIPGLPKDALTYIVGLTSTKISKSLLIILIARMPSIIISSYIGANLRQQNYQPLLFGLVIVSILLCSGLLFKNKIWNLCLGSKII